MFDVIRSGDLDAVIVEIARLDYEDRLEQILQTQESDGKTLLHVAAYEGYCDIVSTLLSYGANIKALDKGGKTPLMLAESAGHLRVVTLLRTRTALQGDTPFSVLRILSLLTDASFKIKNIFENYASDCRDGAVLIVGNTGAGKSTLFNYMLGAEYELSPLQKNGELPSARLSSGREYAITGSSMQSTTLYPNISPPLSGDNYVFCDLPGFGENRGDEASICAASSVQLLTHMPPRLIKAILVVVNFLDFSVGRGSSFKNTIKILNRILSDTYSFREQPVYFVINKAPRGMAVETLIRTYINGILEGASSLNKQQMKQIDKDDSKLYEVLNWMQEHPQYIFISDIFDHGESRNKIKDVIASAIPFESEKLNFMNQEGPQKEFQQVLLNIAYTFSDKLKELELTIPYTINSEKATEISETSDIERWTSEINNMKRQVQLVAEIEKKDALIKAAKARVAESINRREESQKKAKNINFELEINADLFIVIYDIMNILEMKEKIARDFQRDFIEKFGKRTTTSTVKNIFTTVGTHANDIITKPIGPFSKRASSQLMNPQLDRADNGSEKITDSKKTEKALLKKPLQNETKEILHEQLFNFIPKSVVDTAAKLESNLTYKKVAPKILPKPSAAIIAKATLINQSELVNKNPVVSEPNKEKNNNISNEAASMKIVRPLSLSKMRYAMTPEISSKPIVANTQISMTNMINELGKKLSQRNSDPIALSNTKNTTGSEYAPS